MDASFDVFRCDVCRREPRSIVSLVCAERAARVRPVPPPLRMYVAKSTGAVPSNNNEAIGELGGALFLLIRGGGVCTPPRASPEVNENEGG